MLLNERTINVENFGMGFIPLFVLNINDENMA